VVCEEWAFEARSRGENVEFLLYQGAHHSYDDPGKRRQSHQSNRLALEDSLRRAGAFFRAHLRP
jgi:carboxymethylenebutenolidase